MNWKQLENSSDIELLVAKSYNGPQVIFKHSTRCSISSLAFNRMQSCNATADYYILNVIASRPLSNHVADQFEIMHQSPQLLIINNGKCFIHASHFEISAEMVETQLNLLHN